MKSTSLQLVDPITPNKMHAADLREGEPLMQGYEAKSTN